MADDNQNQQQPQPRRINLGFILTIILVLSTIGLIIFLIFGRRTSYDAFNAYQFFVNTKNDKVQSVNIANYNKVVVVLTGVYKQEGKQDNFIYQATISYEEYAEHKFKDETGETKGPYNDYTIADLISTKQQEAEEKGTTFTVTTSNLYQTTWWDQWGPTIIVLGVSVLIAIFLFSRLSSSMNSANNKALDFNRSRARKEKNVRIKFSDVAGCDEEKAEMQELVSYLKEPQKYVRAGAKLPKGVLLVGSPGTGKTLLAKAVAGEADVPFFSISGSDFVEMFVGVGAGRVRDMFRIAKQNAPCLIFIDEIDAVGRQRGAGLGGGNDEREQTLNQLLVEMDGFSDNSGIIVIAATNRDDVLDPALLRAGRFDRKITVSLPNKEGREAIFKVHSRNKKIASDVDFAALSARTVGFSGADIENIMNEAAILSVRKNKEEIGMDEIDESIDRRVAGPAKNSKSFNEHERQIVAYHEAGHAIIGLYLPHSDKVQKITIIPRGNTGGHVRMTPEDDRFLLTKRELEARIVGYLGGRSSEETFFDDISSGAQNDIEVATRIARIMVTELGMSTLGPIQYERDTGSVFLGRDYASSQKNFSPETAIAIDKEVRKIIDESHDLAKKIIKEHKDEVILIANTLIKHEQITAEEIDYLLKNGHLKRDEIIDVPVEEPKIEEDKVSVDDSKSLLENKDKIDGLLNELHATSYHEGCDWKDYKVLIPDYEKDVINGEPTVILIKGDEIRLSNYDESFEYLKYEQLQNEKGVEENEVIEKEEPKVKKEDAPKKPRKPRTKKEDKKEDEEK